MKRASRSTDEKTHNPVISHSCCANGIERVASAFTNDGVHAKAPLLRTVDALHRTKFIVSGCTHNATGRWTYDEWTCNPAIW